MARLLGEEGDEATRQRHDVLATLAQLGDRTLLAHHTEAAEISHLRSLRAAGRPSASSALAVKLATTALVML